MLAIRILPALDELEDSDLRRRPGAKELAAEHLRLQRSEEACTERVVEATSYRPDRAPDAGLPAPETDGAGSILAALVPDFPPFFLALSALRITARTVVRSREQILSAI